jgi:hypothetical protein
VIGVVAAVILLVGLGILMSRSGPDHPQSLGDAVYRQDAEGCAARRAGRDGPDNPDYAATSRCLMLPQAGHWLCVSTRAFLSSMASTFIRALLRVNEMSDISLPVAVIRALSKSSFPGAFSFASAFGSSRVCPQLRHVRLTSFARASLIPRRRRPPRPWFKCAIRLAQHSAHTHLRMSWLSLPIG